MDNGNVWPETVAVVLWGTDNIKTYGESLAQVRRLGAWHGHRHHRFLQSVSRPCWPKALVTASKLFKEASVLTPGGPMLVAACSKQQTA